MFQFKCLLHFDTLYDLGKLAAMRATCSSRKETLKRKSRRRIYWQYRQKWANSEVFESTIYTLKSSSQTFFDRGIVRHNVMFVKVHHYRDTNVISRHTPASLSIRFLWLVSCHEAWWDCFFSNFPFLEDVAVEMWLFILFYFAYWHTIVGIFRRVVELACTLSCPLPLFQIRVHSLYRTCITFFSYIVCYCPLIFVVQNISHG